MSVRISNLPQGRLPLPEAHLHKVYFKLPYNTTEANLYKLARKITGLKKPVLHREYGTRYQYNAFYTLRNDHDAVLITFYIDGTGRAKDTTFAACNGLCFETWTHPSHNPTNINVNELISFVFDEKGHFSSIDLALNDFRKVLDWDMIVYTSDKERFRDRQILRLNKTRPPYYCRQEAEGIYWGSIKSRTQIYSYKKQDKELTKFPWIRFEAKVRGKAQCDHVARMILEGTLSLDEITKGILGYYLQFVEEGTQLKNRRKPCDWWTKFVGTNKISLNPPKAEEEPDEYEGFDYKF